MNKTVVSGLLCLLLVFLSITPVEAQKKKHAVYFEVGALLPALWSAGFSADLQFKNRLSLSPEILLLGRGTGIVAAPALVMNYKADSYFFGAGIGTMTPVTDMDDDDESFTFFKLNAGFVTGKVKITFYILRFLTDDDFLDQYTILGVSLGFTLKKKKKNK